jgi:hypothetical protein
MSMSNTLFLLVSFLVQYPAMIAGPLLLGWWIRRRYGAGWGIFWAGRLYGRRKIWPISFQKKSSLFGLSLVNPWWVHTPIS